MSNLIPNIFKDNYPAVESDQSRRNLTFNKIGEIYEKHYIEVFDKIKELEDSTFSFASQDLRKLKKIDEFLRYNGGNMVPPEVNTKYQKLKMKLLDVIEADQIDAFLDKKLGRNAKLFIAKEYLEKSEKEIINEFFNEGFGTPQERFYLELLGKEKKTFSLKTIKDEYPGHSEDVEKMLYSSFQDTFAALGYNQSINFAKSSEGRDAIRVKLTPMPTKDLFAMDYANFKDKSYFITGMDIMIGDEKYQTIQLMEEEVLPIEVKNRALTKDLTFFTRGLQGTVVVKKV